MARLRGVRAMALVLALALASWSATQGVHATDLVDDSETAFALDMDEDVRIDSGDGGSAGAVDVGAAVEFDVAADGAAHRAEALAPSRLLSQLKPMEFKRESKFPAQPTTFKDAVVFLYDALNAGDLEAAFLACKHGLLFQRDSDLPPPQPLGPDGKKSRLAVDLIISSVDQDPFALDIAQCLLESRQVPIRWSEERPDWFGLTKKSKPGELLLTGVKAMHPGLVSVMLELNAKPPASMRNVVPFHAGLNPADAQRYVRTALNPDPFTSARVLGTPFRAHEGISRQLTVFGTDAAYEHQAAVERLAILASEHYLNRNTTSTTSRKDAWLRDGLMLTGARAALTLKLLRDAGITYKDAKLQDDVGRTVFHGAAMSNYALALHPLALDAASAAREGVLDIKDRWGYTALDYARFRGFDEVGIVLADAMGGDHRYYRYNEDTPVFVEPGLPEPQFTSDAAGSGGWHLDIATDLLPEGGVARCDVDQRSDITAEEFIREYVAKNRPLILRGYARDWDVRQKWTRSNLNATRGHLHYDVVDIPYAKHFGVAPIAADTSLAFYLKRASGRPITSYQRKEKVDAWKKRGKTVEDMPTPVGNYIFDSGNSLSAENTPLMRGDLGHIPPPFLDYNLTTPDDAPEYLRHVEVPNMLFNDLKQPTVQFYAGAPGTGAPAHFHGEAYNVLAYGAKRWLLTPPRNAFYSATASVRWVRAKYDDHVALNRVPRLLECVQLAGDVMYVPLTWTHLVVNLQDNVGGAVEFQSLASPTPNSGSVVARARDVAAARAAEQRRLRAQEAW